MFGNRHSLIRTKRSIFLHYFDIHFIEEHFGNSSLSSVIIEEMEIATRIVSVKRTASTAGLGSGINFRKY
jgi:hypothetical protein